VQLNGCKWEADALEAIEVKDLRKCFGKVEVLKGINLRVERGRLLACAVLIAIFAPLTMYLYRNKNTH
jgi:hypothetical protein